MNVLLVHCLRPQQLGRVDVGQVRPRDGHRHRLHFNHAGVEDPEREVVHSDQGFRFATHLRNEKHADSFSRRYLLIVAVATSLVLILLLLSGCPLLTSSGLSNLVQLRHLTELELTNCPGTTTELIDYLRQNLPNALVLD